MSEKRITLAQAEAAADLLGKAAWTANVGLASLMAVESAEATLRAYLAQRPDEETVRKGRVAAGMLHAMDCDCAPETSHTTATVDPNCAIWRSVIRAAMYQPEEEA